MPSETNSHQINNTYSTLLLINFYANLHTSYNNGYNATKALSNHYNSPTRPLISLNNHHNHYQSHHPRHTLIP